MSTMDRNGISWVGNIYQKFEAMCLEVEEAMYQDTAKYVENQVQTVGASVKKFYSEVMQDLVPHPVNPMKVDDADLSLNACADVMTHKKPKAKSIKADTMQLTEDFNGIAGVEANHDFSFKGTNKDGGIYKRSNACIKRISRKANYSTPSEKSRSNTPLSKDLSRASLICEMRDNCELVNDKIALISPGASIEVIGRGSSQEGKIYDDIKDATVSTDDALNESPTSDINLSVDSSGKKGRKLRCDSSGDGLQGESTDTCTNSALVAQMGSYTSSDTQDSQSFCEEVFTSRTGSAGDCTMDVIKNTDTLMSKPRIEVIEQDDKTKLEDSCVWVDGEKLCFVPHSEGKHRSYKKKIRKAFSSKIRSTRKQEYEQLAVQYEEINKVSNPENVVSSAPTVMADSHSKKLSTHDICESEWELL